MKRATWKHAGVLMALYGGAISARALCLHGTSPSGRTSPARINIVQRPYKAGRLSSMDNTRGGSVELLSFVNSDSDSRLQSSATDNKTGGRGNEANDTATVLSTAAMTKAAKKGALSAPRVSEPDLYTQDSVVQVKQQRRSLNIFGRRSWSSESSDRRYSPHRRTSSSSSRGKGKRGSSSSKRSKKSSRSQRTTSSSKSFLSRSKRSRLTPAPTRSSSPTRQPSAFPSPRPSPSPSSSHTANPSAFPSPRPSPSPSKSPTSSPSAAPSPQPSPAPSPAPSSGPTLSFEPTHLPSKRSRKFSKRSSSKRSSKKSSKGRGKKGKGSSSSSSTRRSSSSSTSSSSEGTGIFSRPNRLSGSTQSSRSKSQSRKRPWLRNGSQSPHYGQPTTTPAMIPSAVPEELDFSSQPFLQPYAKTIHSPTFAPSSAPDLTAASSGEVTVTATQFCVSYHIDSSGSPNAVHAQQASNLLCLHLENYFALLYRLNVDPNNGPLRCSQTSVQTEILDSPRACYEFSAVLSESARSNHVPTTTSMDMFTMIALSNPVVSQFLSNLGTLPDGNPFESTLSVSYDIAGPAMIGAPTNNNSVQPSLLPSLSPSEAPSVSPISFPLAVQVSATPCCVEYGTSAATGKVNNEEAQHAANLTCGHLTEYVTMFYGMNRLTKDDEDINLESINCAMTSFHHRTGIQPPRLCYAFAVLFSNDADSTNHTLTTASLDMLVMVALSTPVVSQLEAELVENLPHENMFSTTSSISYTFETMQLDQKGENGVVSTADWAPLSVLLSVSFLVAISGIIYAASMVRKKRRNAKKALCNQSWWVKASADFDTKSVEESLYDVVWELPQREDSSLLSPHSDAHSDSSRCWWESPPERPAARTDGDSSRHRREKNLSRTLPSYPTALTHSMSSSSSREITERNDDPLRPPRYPHILS